jgi:hypothetical protein
MTAAPGDTQITLKALGREKRAEVFRLANKGERHPDPVVALAASRWSHAERWNSLPNRAPGWLLPLVGILFIVLALAAPVPLLHLLSPLFVVGGVVVVVCGVLGWISTSSARTLRAIYPEEPAADDAALGHDHASG